MKQQLIFDTTTTDEDRDNVGAYVRSSDGTLITHTTENANERLDVDAAIRASNGDAITVTAGAIDVNVASGDLSVDLSHTEDSVRLGDGTSFFTSTSENGDIALDVHLSNTNIEVTQGTSPWVVSATQLDIDDLNATDDAVASWTHDGTGTAIGSTAGALDVYITGSDPLTVNDAALANTDFATTKTSITTTSGSVIATALADRKYLFIHNNGNKRMYIGKTTATADGFPVAVGATLELRAGAALDIKAVTASGTADSRSLELS